MKIAAVFIILLVVLLPVMGASMTGDGTLKGRLQTFVSYGLSLTSLLLCLLTIIVSIYSLTSDIEQRQIYTVLTKPIRRFQLLLGKLLGVILLDVALLVLFSAIIYGITIYTPKFYNATEAELAQVENEFYTARAALTPPEVDVTQGVLDAYSKLENWEFDNVKPLDPNQSLFVKFKYDVSVNPPDLQVYGRWVVGDYRQVRYGEKIKTPIYTFDRKDLIRTFYEQEVPADAVAEDGYLAVGFLNVPLNNTPVIFPPDGLQVLYEAGSFTANFIKAVLLILFRLIFLASLGILASTFLSFPVAILLSLVVFFTATFSGFCLESFDFLSENLSGLYRYTVRPVILLLPQFDKFNPTKFLVPARLVGWSLLARVALSLICIKAVLLLLLALLIFSFREIAKVII